MIKLTINGENAFFALEHIRAVTPNSSQTMTLKSLITVGDTEDNMFYVDQTCDEIEALFPEGLSL